MAWAQAEGSPTPRWQVVRASERPNAAAQQGAEAGLIPGTQEVDRAVASVDRTVITWSELVFEARRLLFQQGEEVPASFFAEDKGQILRAIRAHIRTGAQSQVGPVLSQSEEQAGFLLSVLELLVQRRLLVSEARRLRVQGPPRQTLRTAIDEIIEQGGDVATLFGFAEARAMLQDSLRSEQLAARFSAIQLRSVAKVSERDFRRCLRKRPLAQPNLLREAMNDARKEAQLATLLTRLRRKSEVLYAEPFFRKEVEEVSLCPK